MTAFRLCDQRYMVSPCGTEADWFHESEIADEAPDWTDCTDMADATVGRLMERRMQARRQEADEAKHDMAISERELDIWFPDRD